ncbi:MAG: flagellar basal body rod protein FlgB [Planctomycetaceae bacterium]|nr:flagellar basal body rod protein FlgB [Planctomycetaceae bacterium]
MALFNNNFDMLSRLLSAAEQRQQVISHNIANVNTPHYQRLELRFEDALAEEIQRQRRGHSVGRPAETSIGLTPGLATRADGNNVDIDKEIGQLNKNALLQQTYLQLMGTEIEQMRRAMQGQ